MGTGMSGGASGSISMGMGLNGSIASRGGVGNLSSSGGGGGFGGACCHNGVVD